MPLTKLSLKASLGWTLSKPNPPFGKTTEGPDSLFFPPTPTNINVATFNQIYTQAITLAASASTTLDLTSLTNLVQETFSLSKALILYMNPVGAPVKVIPAASNGLVWFFGVAANYLVIPSTAVLIYTEPLAGPGQTIDSTHKDLTFTNTGGVATILNLAIAGGT